MQLHFPFPPPPVYLNYFLVSVFIIKDVEITSVSLFPQFRGGHAPRGNAPWEDFISPGETGQHMGQAQFDIRTDCRKCVRLRLTSVFL